MSLGGGRVQAFNDLVDFGTLSEILTVVAAGNENADACTVSPASALSAITVAAEDITDTRAFFSNFGVCVDIYAPGVEILSSFVFDVDSFAVDPTRAYRTDSGTSMSSPHVAGAAALLDSLGGTLTPAQLTTMILSNATPNKIISNVGGTPNLLLFVPNVPACPFEIASFDGITKFCVVDAATRDNAELACEALGGQLSNIQSSAESAYLSTRVPAQVWIRAWQGNTYGGACLSYFPGGAFAVVGCGESHQGLCDVPI